MGSNFSVRIENDHGQVSEVQQYKGESDCPTWYNSQVINDLYKMNQKGENN